MRIESLACDNCGAPLEVPEQANYVRCNHCDSQLAIHRGASVSYTELVDKIVQRADRLTDEVARLGYENELASIDRSWDRQRESLMLTDKNGRRSEPSMTGAMIGTVVAVFIGLIATASAGPFGLIFLAFAGVIGTVGWVKASEFEKAKRRYRRRRASVSMDSIRNRIAGDDGDLESTARSDPASFLQRLEEG